MMMTKTTIKRGYIIGTWRGNKYQTNSLAFYPYIKEAREVAKCLLDEEDITAVGIYSASCKYWHNGSLSGVSVGKTKELWRKINNKYIKE